MNRIKNFKSIPSVTYNDNGTKFIKFIKNISEINLNSALFV